MLTVRFKQYFMSGLERVKRLTDWRQFCFMIVDEKTCSLNLSFQKNDLSFHNTKLEKKYYIYMIHSDYTENAQV